MIAVIISLLAVAIALFVVFMGLRAQHSDGKRRDEGDAGGYSGSDTGPRRPDANDHDGDAGSDAGSGDSGGGDGGGGGD